jgi:hypothetical protein
MNLQERIRDAVSIFLMYRLRTLITWQLIKVLAGNYNELDLGAHVTHGGEKRNSHRLLVEKPEGAWPPLKTGAWMEGYL